MRKIGHLDAMAGHFAIYYDEKDRYNPYKLYRITWELRKQGYHTKGKKLVNKYADLLSVMLVLEDWTRHHNEETTDRIRR